jgi:dephospho-CoA kinase
MITLGILGGIASGKSTLTAYLVSKGACHLDGDKINHEVLNYPEIIQQIKSRWPDAVDNVRIDLDKLLHLEEHSIRNKLIFDKIVEPFVYSKIRIYDRFFTKVDFTDVPLLVKTLDMPEVIEQVTTFWSETKINAGVNRKKLANIVFNDPNELRILEDIVWPITNAKIHESFVRYNQTHTKVLILDVPMLIETGWITLCDKTVFLTCPEETRIERFALRQGYTIEEATSQLRSRENRQIDLNQKREKADWVLDTTEANKQLAVKLGLIKE